MLAATANSQAEPAPQFLPGDRVAVLLPLPLAGAYDYVVGDGVRLSAGDVVRVPLGRRQVVGVAWGPGSGEVAQDKCRAVLAMLAAPRLPEESRRFVDWVAAYTLSSPGAVLKMAISVPAALEPPPATVHYRATGLSDGIKLTPARQRVLAVAADPAAASELARRAGVGAAVVRGLIGAGALGAVPLAGPALPEPDWRRSGVALSADQAAAAAHLRSGVGHGFAVTLLEGVTGSGKTEVYLEAVAEALAQDRQVLVLLPEIALSAQWLGRFTARFGVAPCQWHCDLGDKVRRNTWRAVADGSAKVVVGARSALFLPFPRLGLIVVDEEHDGSFKQEDGVVYQARDMAVVRARIGDIPAVLVSATPSLETQVNVQTGRYRHLRLPNRYGGAQLPVLQLIDLRRHAPPRGSWLSAPLADAVSETLAAGEQAMLFLNRRGYAPLTLCRACGHRLQCPYCSAWLVEHRRRAASGEPSARLACHHCGYSSPLPASCPSCQAEDQFAACGPGVERLAEEVAVRFPAARLAVMASDTLTGPTAAAELVERMAERDIDLLIGTQVVAKGHHFPWLTLVGVVDADLGLAGGDLRAAERTFQLLSQVAGRAGRAQRPGRVLLQTYQPEDKVMMALASGDAERFFAVETDDRRNNGMPPFGRLAAIIVSGPEAGAVDRTAGDLARSAPRGGEIEIYGPAPAPLSLLRGRHRRRLLVKAAKSTGIQGLLRQWLRRVTPPSGVRIQVDIDPYSFI
jgi:primosomal protein N' (replication factor Y)